MRTATVCEQGGRPNNEDAVRRVRSDDKYCFVAADGLGGQSSGEVASRLAADTIIDCFRAQALITPDIMFAYLEAAQNAIIEKRKESLAFANMATTVAALITDGTNAVWANCGDSRVYRFAKNKIHEVTEDQSVAFMSFLAGEIQYDDIRRSPDQNKLLHSLSDGKTFKPNITGPVILPPKTSFLLCTDGFWEYVDETVMEKTRRRAKTPRDWLSEMLAYRRKVAPPDADNYSAVAVFV